jgi:uncharacterized protein DUF397
MSAPSRSVTSGLALRGARWRRSSYSTGANNCVETARLVTGAHAGSLAVRDSKNAAGPAVLFSHDAWRAFLGAVR